MKNFYSNGRGMAFAEGSSHPPTIDASCRQFDKERDREIQESKWLNARSILSSPFLTIPRNLAAIGYAVVRYGFDRCSTAIRRVVEAGLELGERRVEPLSNQSRRSLEQVSKSSRRRVEEEWKKRGGIYKLFSSTSAGHNPFSLMKKDSKNQDWVERLNCFQDFYNQTNSLCSDKFDYLTKSINNSLRLTQPRSSFRDRADCTADAKDKKESNYLFITENVALQSFEKMQDNSQSVVSKLFSDTLLGTFGKTKVPCLRGRERKKDSGLGKEKGVVLLDPSVVEMTKKEEVVLSSNRLLRHLAPDVDDKKELNQTHRPLRTVRGDDRKGGKVLCKSRSTSSQISKFAFLLIFICCLFSYAALAQPHKDSVAAAGVGEIKPLQIGDTIPEALWQMPLQVVNHPEGKDTIRLADYRDKKLIILDFWATWCAPCVKSMDKWEKIQNKNADNLVLIGVHIGNRTKNIQHFVNGRNWKSPSIIEESSRSLNKFFFSAEVVSRIVWLYDNQIHFITGVNGYDGDMVSRFIDGQAIHISNRLEWTHKNDEI